MENNAVTPRIQSPIPSKVRWTGRILSYLCILFLMFDAIAKIVRESHSVEGSVKLGWPDGSVTALGILLLACTVLYLVPRTAVLGAILLTGYLGGAIAIMFVSGQPFYFPLVFGILLWTALWLRKITVRNLLPIQKVSAKHPPEIQTSANNAETSVAL